MKIRSHLYQVGGDLNGLTWDGVDAGFNDANCYVLYTPEGYLMFDCGCGNTLNQIFDNMIYWGLSPDRIRYCLITHAHLDHAGAAHKLKDRGVQLVASSETAEAIAVGDERCAGYLYHQTFQPCEIDQIVEDGDVLDVLGVQVEVMLLPGHTMGCTAYLFELDGQRIIVSGDVIGTLNVGDFGWEGSIDFNKSEYIRSLTRLARMDTDIMLPGHGLIYFYQPRRRVEQVLNAALIQWR